MTFKEFCVKREGHMDSRYTLLKRKKNLSAVSAKLNHSFPIIKEKKV